jgi:membrane-associated protease RseP (regulator of RpoE activity)
MSAERPPRYRVNLLLFLATVLTTTAQGASYVHKGESMWPLWDGWVYSVPLLLILLSHEFGHYVAARLHGVPASLPYFIPLPPPIGLLGTMGAVITQEATTDRKKLIDIGAAGPLAGLVVAIPVLWIGLRLSSVVPPGPGLQEGNSLLYALLKRVVTGQWLPGAGRDVDLHPTAWAGWAGLLVTMLNLIPIGQLDGGHVATAYFGNDYKRVAGFLHRCLPFLAATAFVVVAFTVRHELAGRPAEEVRWLPLQVAVMPTFFWLMWTGVLGLMRRMSGGQYHPPVEAAPLPRSRRILFWVVCVTFLLTFMPIPLRINVGKTDVPRKAAPAAAP